MAKKKKKPARRTSRRRVGMVKSDLLMTVAGMAGGIIGASMLESKFAPQNPKVVHGGMVVCGVFVATKVANPLFKGALLGAAAAGGVGLLRDFNVISGVGGMGAAALIPFSVNQPMMGGYGDIRSIGAPSYSNVRAVGAMASAVGVI